MQNCCVRNGLPNHCLSYCKPSEESLVSRSNGNECLRKMDIIAKCQHAQEPEKQCKFFIHQCKLEVIDYYPSMFIYFSIFKIPREKDAVLVREYHFNVWQAVSKTQLQSNHEAREAQHAPIMSTRSCGVIAMKVNTTHSHIKGRQKGKSFVWFSSNLLHYFFNRKIITVH